MLDKKNKPRDFNKLGGWLLVFVVVYFLQAAIGVLTQFGEGGMMDVLRGWSMYDGVHGWLLLAGQIVSLVTTAIFVFTAIAILQRDPYFLRNRQMALVAAGIDVLIKLAEGLLYGLAGYGWPSLMLQAGFLLCSVWIVRVYYTRSGRVRAYMGSDEYLRLGLFAKGAGAGDE